VAAGAGHASRALFWRTDMAETVLGAIPDARIKTGLLRQEA
jgi:hypothetical protein